MSSTKRDADHIFKICIVGQINVGKTCLLLKFADNNFVTEPETTIGGDYKSRVLKMNGVTVKLQVWDTAGQEKFSTITNSFYRNARGVILCVDISDKESLQSETSNYANRWLEEIRNNTKSSVAILPVGTKLDLTKQRQIQKEHMEAWAKENKLLDYMEVSSKSGENVEEAFNKIAAFILSNLPKDAKKTTSEVDVNNPPKKKGKCCII